MHSSEEAKQLIRTFLSRYFRSESLPETEDIFATALVSSMAAVELVLFLEKEFQIKLASEDLNIDNFRTLEKMAALVARKRPPSA